MNKVQKDERIHKQIANKHSKIQFYLIKPILNYKYDKSKHF